MPTPRLPAVFAALALFGGSSTVSLSPAAAEEVLLTVFIENVSSETTLKLPNGETKSVPVAPGAYVVVRGRSAERRVGKECVRMCRSRWWQSPYKKNTTESHKRCHTS